MAKITLSCIIVLLAQLTSANENIININKKLNGIQTEVNLIQKSLNQNKSSKQQLSKQLTETKNILIDVENNIETINNKKFSLEKKLERLENQININKDQLNSYESSINITINNLLIVKIKLKQNSNLINNDQADNNIKKLYLNEIFEKEINKIKDLKSQMIQLESDYNQLYKQINHYRVSLENLKKNQSNYNQLHNNKLNQYKTINYKIDNDLNKIQELKNKEQALNKLLKNLLNLEDSNNNKEYKYNKTNYLFPIKSIIKVNFGEKRDGIINKGVLFKFIENSDVISIDEGKIVYVGNLNNLGNVIIIQHLDNFVSIYCGIIPIVKSGVHVTKGEVIAKTGSSVYRTLDGIYFELRYKGQPVNPFK